MKNTELKKLMSEMLQEIVERYSAKEDRFSKIRKENGATCLFQSPSGNRCAVGFYLSETMIKFILSSNNEEKVQEICKFHHIRNLNNGTVTELKTVINELKLTIPLYKHPKYEKISTFFWDSLQALHDSSHYWTFSDELDRWTLTKEGEEKVKYIRTTYCLEK